MLKERLIVAAFCIFALICCAAGMRLSEKISVPAQQPEAESATSESYIKWVDFSPTYSALSDAMELDISTYKTQRHLSWIDTLSYLACKNGGNFSGYKRSQLDKLVEALGDDMTPDDLMRENKYYNFYKKAYGAVLSGMLGEYTKAAPDGSGGIKAVEGYGLRAYSPIAEGFWFSHYDDFGDSRSFGYKRRHLGNDLMGSIGTPIAAVEGGTVEAIGWNRYGGWRIAVRSFDGKRSYYYAHLRRNKPYKEGLEIGSKVRAGEIIGYLGMTGYSSEENVNGMNVPHLHLGMQLIFNEVQKEGNNQIWIDMYSIVELLNRNKATVVKDEESGEYKRVYDIFDDTYPEDMRHLTTLPQTAVTEQ
ncbi:MAG: M23 family metallopeptidase [Oscillospiraceae bacterium]|nr:M23 family metallopeptidase [Oscillospiraceae bacterium]